MSAGTRGACIAAETFLNSTLNLNSMLNLDPSFEFRHCYEFHPAALNFELDFELSHNKINLPICCWFKWVGCVSFLLKSVDRNDVALCSEDLCFRLRFSLPHQRSRGLEPPSNNLLLAARYWLATISAPVAIIVLARLAPG
jgi:hypothetical protein